MTRLICQLFQCSRKDVIIDNEEEKNVARCTICGKQYKILSDVSRLQRAFQEAKQEREKRMQKMPIQPS